MSVCRSPPATPSSITPVKLTQSESDLLRMNENKYVNINRNKRHRTDSDSPLVQDDQDLKQEIIGLLHNWKLEFDTKVNEMCEKQKTTILKLSTEITELKKQTAKIHESNDEVTKSMGFINNQFEEIKTGLDNIQKERIEHRHCIEKLERKVLDLQQKSRPSGIEIRNIPMIDKETNGDLMATVGSIGQTVGINISESDLRDIYRLPGKRGATRPIVVEFHSVQKKLNTLSSVRAFNNKKKTANEKLNTEIINIPGKRQPIYVAEYLSASSKRLFYLARDFASKNGFTYCWSSNGNIFLRKTQGEKQILVSTEKCLLDLKKNM